MDVSTLVATIAYMGKEMNPGDGVGRRKFTVGYEGI